MEPCVIGDGLGGIKTLSGGMKNLSGGVKALSGGREILL